MIQDHSDHGASKKPMNPGDQSGFIGSFDVPCSERSLIQITPKELTLKCLVSKVFPIANVGLAVRSFQIFGFQWLSTWFRTRKHGLPGACFLHKFIKRTEFLLLLTDYNKYSYFYYRLLYQIIDQRSRN